MNLNESAESLETPGSLEAPAPVEALVIAPGRVLPKYLTEPDSFDVLNSISQSKWATLMVLFVVTAVLGIPMLWRNERFNMVERLFWSLLVIVYTIAIIVAMVWWIRSTLDDAISFDGAA